MTSDLAPQAERKPALPVLINIGLSGTFAVMLSAWVSFIYMPPSGWYEGHSFMATTDWLFPYAKAAWQQTLNASQFINHLRDPLGSLSAFAWHFDHYHLSTPLIWRFTIVLLASSSAILASGLYTSSYLEAKSLLTHIRGRQLFKGTNAARKARQLTKRDLRKSGRGIEVSPKVSVSLESETKHFLLVGASGSGKTQILLSWIKQLLKQNTKMLLHDTKGDLTSSLPNDNFILLAPHDERTWGWDIAKDCQGIAAARELASRLIPEGKEPMWSNGAREILTGIIRSLQNQHKISWGWEDLRDAAFLDAQELKDLLDRVHPEGAKYIEVDPETGIPNKTSFSFLVSLWSNIGSLVGPLALAWGDLPEDRRISLTDWLADDDVEQRVLILQRSAEFDELSKAWIGAAIQLMANFAASPSLSDSRSRRVWLFLDEFAQMGKVKGFHQFLEVGRSRGIRSVIGLQDLEQLTELYGPEALKTWLNTIETKIVCRMNAGPSASFIVNELIGQREVSWVEHSKTYTHGGFFDDKQSSTNSSKQTKTATTPVLLPDFLERNLGPKSLRGEIKIRALLLLQGDVFQLDWPLTVWPEQRPGTVPAPWTKA